MGTKKNQEKDWKLSERAKNYRVDETKRTRFNDKLGDIIDDSYLECEKTIIECYSHTVKSDEYRIDRSEENKRKAWQKLTQAMEERFKHLTVK